jgi:hypothetical protein
MTNSGAGTGSLRREPSDSPRATEPRNAKPADELNARILRLAVDRPLYAVWRLNSLTGRPELQWSIGRK